ncbi:MAG: hypothetical protein V4719_00865 [Planctomycetota bacterium]
MANHHYHLARFHQDQSGIWTPPTGAAGIIDLVPPLQDADPQVNYAFVASDVQLDSSDSLHHFGQGDLRELLVDGTAREAWGAITGYLPQGDSLCDVLCDHLTFGSQANGADFTRSLTCGRNRRLEIVLAGESIWSYSLSGMADALAQPILETELESLRDVYRGVLAGEYSEAVYQRCLGGLGIKYQLSQSAELYLPAADPLLPKLQPLIPQTTKAETWPGPGAVTSGQDQPWSVLAGTWAVSGNKVICSTGSGWPQIRLDYDFGGSDLTCQTQLVAGADNTDSIGTILRKDASATATCYANRINGSEQQVLKFIAGSVSNIGSSSTLTITANGVLKGSAIGSTITSYLNAVQTKQVTDTAIASGLRVGLLQLSTASTATDNVLADDGLSGGGGSTPRRNLLHMSLGLRMGL